MRLKLRNFKAVLALAPSGLRCLVGGWWLQNDEDIVDSDVQSSLGLVTAVVNSAPHLEELSLTGTNASHVLPATAFSALTRVPLKTIVLLSWDLELWAPAQQLLVSSPDLATLKVAELSISRHHASPT